MMYIFENLLDDITGSERATINATPESQFDYILYIGHQTRNSSKKEEREKELSYFNESLDELKEIMNVCVSSYHTDNVLYFQEPDDYRQYWGTKQLSPEEQKIISSFLGGMACYKIYFNFTSDITDILRFFYTVANVFNAWGVHSLQKIYTIDGNELSRDMINMLDREFRTHLSWSDDKTHRCAKEIIKNFWEEKQVLNLPADSEDRIAYVERKITRFITKIQVLDDWRERQEDDD